MNWARKIMGRGDTKSALAPRPWLLAETAAGEPPAGYAGQVRAALGNPVALRAVRLVAEGLSSVKLSARGEPHPAAALMPPALLEQVATHLLLHGNAFVETGLDAGGRAATLWALRPERMQLEVDGRGWPAHWLYRAGGHVQRMALGLAPGRQLGLPARRTALHRHGSAHVQRRQRMFDQQMEVREYGMSPTTAHFDARFRVRGAEAK